MLNIEGVRLEHQRRFEAILRRHGASGLGIAQCFTSIVKSYQEPHRGHHDNQHITEMHYLQDCWGSEIEDRDTMFIATEYHDMVYRVALPGRPKWADENQSIVRMGSDLARLGVSMDFIDGVARLIDISKPGAMPRLTDDEKIFHDADYWIIGSPWERFVRYEAGVRQEYRGDEMPDLYAKGRAAFFESQLVRDRIFDTDRFHQHCHDRAITSMKRMLETLRGEERIAE